MKEARAHLAGDRRGGGKGDVAELPLPLFERTGAKGRARFVVHLERMQDAAIGTPAARAAMAAALRELLAEVEGEGELQNVGTSNG